MSNYYPVILIPREITEAKNATIPEPPLPPKPVAPRAYENSYLGWYILVPCVLFLVNTENDPPILQILGFFLGSFLIYRDIQKRGAHKSDVADYEKKLKSHEKCISARNNIHSFMSRADNNLKEMILGGLTSNLFQNSSGRNTAFGDSEETIYRDYLMRLQDVLKRRMNISEVQKYRQDKVKEILNRTKSAKIEWDSLKGKNETSFLKVLNNHFHGKVQTNRVIEIFQGYEGYSAFSPDFIFKDSTTMLHIDIEIDEPYTSGVGKPIHYINEKSSIDSRRDSYFLSNGWVVIRFAEEQVVKFPDECCKVIAETINQIIGDSTFLNKTWEFNNLPMIERWTYDMAKQMYQMNARERYLLEKRDLEKEASRMNEKLKKEAARINEKLEKEMIQEKIYKEAVLLQESRQYDLAILKYNELLEFINQNFSVGDYVRALSQRAKCHQDAGEFQSAIDDYMTCENLQGESERYYSNIASVYFQMGEFENAELFYTKIIELGDNVDDACNSFLKRALFYSRIGDHELMLKDFEACINIDLFNDYSGYCMLKRADYYIRASNHEKAMEDLSFIIEHSYFFKNAIVRKAEHVLKRIKG